jgi:hypothetical protein
MSKLIEPNSLFFGEPHFVMTERPFEILAQRGIEFSLIEIEGGNNVVEFFRNATAILGEDVMSQNASVDNIFGRAVERGVVVLVKNALSLITGDSISVINLLYDWESSALSRNPLLLMYIFLVCA